ncbi:hypothetical protein HK096_008356 [Nowakowskiella sp. JEL0078]|nr:hypothetical protein HK096_008356 [Nowakowskiella sp. JEL0078]
MVNVSKKQAVVSDNKGNQVGELKGLDLQIEWFLKNQVSDEVSIIHGDYKLDNIVYNSNSPAIKGVLDWELSTIGHPLSDLGNFLLPWFVPDPQNSFIPGLSSDFPEPNSKNLQWPIPHPSELIRRYCENMKREYPIPKFDFVIAFSFFRLSVIAQGIAARVKRGQASSKDAGKVFNFVENLSDIVLSFVDRGDLDESNLLSKL